MKAELLKIYQQRFARFSGAALLALILITSLIMVLTSTSSSPESVFSISVEIPGSIVLFLFGAWMFGNEFKFGTIKLTLLADSRRLRLVFVKLGLFWFLGAAAIACFFLLAFFLYSLAGLNASGSDLADSYFWTIIVGLFSGTIAFGLAMALRNFGGAVILTFLILFIIDPIVLGLVPIASKISLSSNLEIILSFIDPSYIGDGAGIVNALICFGWIAAFVGIGAFLFRRSDIE